MYGRQSKRSALRYGSPRIVFVSALGKSTVSGQGERRGLRHTKRRPGREGAGDAASARNDTHTTRDERLPHESIPPEFGIFPNPLKRARSQLSTPRTAHRRFNQYLLLAADCSHGIEKLIVRRHLKNPRVRVSPSPASPYSSLLCAVSSRCFFKYFMNGVPPVPTACGFFESVCAC